MPLTFLGALPDDEWEPLFSHLLSKADSFLLHMPDGPGPLSNGWGTFQSLPGVVVRPWNGMADAVEIAGPLGVEAREAFSAAEPSLDEMDPERKLWDYRLLRNEQILLSISDFIDLLIDTTELEAMRAIGLFPASLIGADLDVWHYED